MAALHASMVGACISLEDLKADGELLWMGMKENVGLYQMLSSDIMLGRGPGRTDVGVVVFERVLELYKDGEETPDGFAIARIGLPTPEQPTGGAWYCPFEIEGLGEPFGTRIFGEDSAQALVLCLELVGDLLKSRAKQFGRSIRWEGDEDLGFPPLSPIAEDEP